jgi:hypothetical protein
MSALPRRKKRRKPKTVPLSVESLMKNFGYDRQKAEEVYARELGEIDGCIVVEAPPPSVEMLMERGFDRYTAERIMLREQGVNVGHCRELTPEEAAEIDALDPNEYEPASKAIRAAEAHEAEQAREQREAMDQGYAEERRARRLVRE